MRNANHPGIMNLGLGSGVRTSYATILPPNASIAAYVRSTGVQSGDDTDVSRRIFSTLNDGLRQARAGQGDIVIVLPGHEEDISSADQMNELVAGTQILGQGSGNSRPKFNWTAAAASFLFDVDNVSLSNCILDLAPASAGGVTRAAPITVSGDGCSINACEVLWGADDDDIVTVGLTLTGDNFSFLANECMAAAAAVPGTTFMQVNGADRLTISGGTIMGETSAVTTGVLDFITAASTNVVVNGTVFSNRVALSQQAVSVGVLTTTGHFHGCGFGIGTGTAPVTAGTDLQFTQCQYSNALGGGGADF